MSTLRKLIPTYCKTRECYKFFISCGSYSHESRITQNIFVHNKLLKLVPHRILPVLAQSTLHFSTSTVYKTEFETMCEGDKRVLNVSYKDLLEAQKDDSVLIIDVREQSEIEETGKLPGSIHIPMGDVANTLLSLSEADFKDKFVKEKPSKDTKIILSCRSGKRSGMVQEELQKLGYQNTYNYIGGWLDWESNQKV